MKTLLTLFIVVTLFAHAKENRLYSPSAEASSYLQSNWNKYQENYHPNYAFDDVASTAWVEGAEGDGVGETLTWPVSKLVHASKVKLRVRNGYQKSKKLFEANAAPKKVLVTLYGKGGRESLSKEFGLKREMGWQEIVMEPEANDGLSRIEIKVLEVYPGKVYRDTCISDVQTLVETKVPYDEVAEKAKDRALHAWTKERLATAKFFAKKPAEYPWAATNFDQKIEEEMPLAKPYLDPAQDCVADPKKFFTDVLKPGSPLHTPELKKSGAVEKALGMVKLAHQALAEKKLFQAKPTVAAQNWVAPDGLYMFPFADQGGWTRFLKGFYSKMRAGEIALLETKSVVAEKKSHMGQDEVVSNAYALFHDKNRKQPRALVMWVNGSIQERGVYHYLYYIIYEYDTDGRLVQMTAWKPDQLGKLGDALKAPTERKIGTGVMGLLKYARFKYDASGRVSAVDAMDLQGDFGDDCDWASGKYVAWEMVKGGPS